MILAGGSGSTGSSLLQAILNRHPRLLAGQETCLFIYPHLFYRWNRYKHFLIRRGVLGIKSTGWSLRNGADLLHPGYGWERAELEHAIRQSGSFGEFVRRFFQKALERKGADTWVEKTPQNACSFRTFLKEFPQGKLIHTLRNPYDTMASLLARGFDAYQAAGYYVYHAAAAASANGDERYFEVRYEDLVSQPEATVRLLFDFLELPFDPAILQPTAEELANPLKIESWNHSERGNIERSSVGRFERLPQERQQEVMAALGAFRISEGHLRKHGIRFADCRSLCRQVGYEFREADPAPFLANLRRYRRLDMMRRTLRLHPTYLLNYPGGISVAK
jgi:hypothetical protein